MMALMMSMPSSPPPTISSSPPPNLPLRSIPGTYGWPMLGPMSDRLDYFWFQGPATFFKKRMEKYKSTVFRTNVPPCFPFFTDVNPNVIAVLDCKSFSHLFDMDVIDKKNVLVGDFMPSMEFTGNMRVGVYLDPTEEHHGRVKDFSMDILKRSSGIWVSSLLSSLDTMWTTVEESLSKDSSASVFIPLQKCLFNFLSKSIIGADPATSPEISESGHIMIDKWLALQLLPTISINRVQPLEEILVHSFRYPFALIRSDYEKLSEFIAKEGTETVERAQTEFGLTKEEAIHNLMFILGFNALGGFSIFLPALLKYLGTDKTGVQDKLRKEVRDVLCGPSSSSSSTPPSFKSVQDMKLLESFVYETLRLSPPVPSQYGRARKDFLLSSHDSVFEVKKGELLCGYQTLVMRDPEVFNDPETFVSDRFLGDSGRELLSYLYWSNGPQNATPGSGNKQCAAAQVVPLTACLLLADLFQRYDSITVDSSGSITALETAK